MNTAERVIAKFGSQTVLAGLLGKRQSTVQHWAKTGVIPAKWHSKLLQLSRDKGIELKPADLIAMESNDGSLAVVESSPPRIPRATHWGELPIGDSVLPCYVLETGERVFSLKGVVVGLIGTEGGQLAEYLKIKGLRSYLPMELTPVDNDRIPCLINFDTGGEGFIKYALGLPVEKFMDLCGAYSSAAEHEDLTERQKSIASTANKFLRASAKVGIVALVDEVTGFQYDRAKDALRLKLSLYLEEEMRKWEKTFPDQLWVEFGRLTNWKGSVHQRPKYWGNLVMELVYGYLDPDVAEWLKNNAPKPAGGRNYHQWLSGQYGLKRLTEHIWMLIGMAASCKTMTELRQKMAERFGRQQVQLTLYLPLPEPEELKG